MSTSGQHGDDLEDDFVPDELVASSGEEDTVFDARPETGDDIQGLLSADEEEQDEPPAEDKAKLAKRKRREKEKERQTKKRKLAETVETIEAPSIATEPPLKIADYMAAMQAKAFSKLSALELDDMRIPETAIMDTTQWTESRSLDRLTDFIVQALPMLHKRLLQKSKAPGAPTLLLIAGAALRVADVTRILKDKRLRGEMGGDVAKLFAKHFKLEDHVSYLSRSKIGSAAGTPGRIGKLLCETDALSVSQLTHIILDVSFRDAKKRNLFDIPETRDEIFKLVLGAPKVLKRIKQGEIHVVLL